MTTAPPTTSGLRIDQLDFRHVMSHLPTGVVAVTGVEPASAQPVGLIVGTFASLSLEPPLVAFSIARTSGSWPKVRLGGRFSASVLAEGQDAVCRSLSRKSGDKFADVPWHPSPDGAPRVNGAVAWIDCEPEQELDGGDHLIVIARVLRMSTGPGEPLVFHKGRLGSYRDTVAA
ncbi:flavin reductase family protein [Streptomyces sp. 110]|uniref:Flavin reductase family protein n=1 Tax=Streptomyces endocoffeicus TaxID=2898945 RepID=A0ABS1PKY7_9ACTN|nr:flavin reductase family protein [Streptomyces endocoffeicus]MBL1113075.1 flavin reductase family protein [Streptomyces endocoffeicus]